MTELSVDNSRAFKFHHRSCKHLAGQKRPAYSVRGTLDSVEQRPTLNEFTLNAGTLNAGTLNAGTLNAGTLNAGTLNAGTLNAGTLNAGTLNERTLIEPTLTERTLTNRRRVLSALQTTTAKALGNDRRSETTRSCWFVYSA